MKNFDEVLAAAFQDTDLSVSDIPNLDLYMDQILTLFDEGLAANKRRPEDKLLTKTMVNNYSKERLIMPLKGKKYSREQLMQLLCILNLKQNLTLTDIKTLTAHENGALNFQAAYETSLALKTRLRERLPELLQTELSSTADLTDREKTLALTLALSAGATYLRRACEQIIDRQ
ncbi:DUF1836 domain-containing protein [Oscillospiraceae bacterium PP1C4]